MVVPVERRQAASDEEDDVLSGNEKSVEEDDKSEFSVSEDEDGARQFSRFNCMCWHHPRRRLPCHRPGDILICFGKH